MLDRDGNETDISGSALLFCGFLYVAYAIGGIASLFPSAMMIASLFLFVILMLTYIKRPHKDAPGVIATHYRWLLRTFWLGMGIYFPVVTVLGMVMAAPAVDTTALMQAMVEGKVSTQQEMSDLLMAQQPASTKIILIVLGSVFGAWWLWRCGYGLRQLWLGQAIDRPARWL